MRGVSAISLGLLAGCVSLSPQETAQRAEQVATVVVSRLYPGMSTAAPANCVRDNATRAELTDLAASAGAVGPEAQITVLSILERPETTACLASNGITLT